MDRLSEKEGIEILMTLGYGDIRRSQQETCNIFDNLYPNRDPITRSTDAEKMQLTEDKSLDVCVMLEEDPYLSPRQKSVMRILRYNKFHPYKITCPGVWLCSSGKVSLQVHMLDSSVQTRSGRPVFPIQCYEKFIFSKTFHSERRLNELQRTLNNQWFYSELIQWQSCDDGYVLAAFQTTLDDLLYPSSYKQTSTSDLEIDLLMEPTKLFPGTIAPKLEVSTKTTIEEILCDLPDVPQGALLINPKRLVSSRTCKKAQPRKVCHSIGFSRAQKSLTPKTTKGRPIFKYRKPSDDLILRTNPNVVLKNDMMWRKSLDKIPACTTCYCRCPKVDQVDLRSSNIVLGSDKPDVICDNREHKDKCNLCSAYEVYFSPQKLKRICHNAESLSELSRRYPKMCSNCKNRVKKCQMTSLDGSFRDETCLSECRRCLCTKKENLNSLAEQLHQKLSRTLEANSSFFQKCIDCGDVAG